MPLNSAATSVATVKADERSADGVGGRETVGSFNGGYKRGNRAIKPRRHCRGEDARVTLTAAECQRLYERWSHD